MSQSVRDRTPELAVLKTVGFTDGGILALVLVETLIFCVLAASIGLSLATFVFPLIEQRLGFEIQPGPVFVTGLAIAVVLALLAGSPPALRAARLQVVDALAGR